MNGNLVKKINKDLELNKEHLNKRKPFKIYYDDDDLGMICHCYNKEDGYYHGIIKDNNGKTTVIGRIDVKTILRAIEDESFWIQVKPVNLIKN